MITNNKKYNYTKGVTMLHSLNKNLRFIYKFQFSLLLLIFILLFSFKMNAQSKSKFFIETDPSTFVFEGYAAHIRINPSALDHIVLGIGTYSMKFPGLIINLDSKNKDLGWNVKLKQGYGIFGDYYFDKAGSGLFVGGQLALQEFKINNSNIAAQEETYTTILIMPRVGYQWYPFDNGFYIMPWMGIGYETKISGINIVGNKPYDISPILPFTTFHIGYRF